jgi:hypothetical protein
MRAGSSLSSLRNTGSSPGSVGTGGAAATTTVAGACCAGTSSAEPSACPAGIPVVSVMRPLSPPGERYRHN